MVRMLSVGAILLIAASTASATEKFINQPNTNGDLEFLISKHASANNVPVALVRRVIKRESRGNPRVISKGNYGLMQIRLGTARAMGYRGSAAGLLDPNVNMTYAVKYLAGAYRAAGGNADRAVALYASGYGSGRSAYVSGEARSAYASGRTYRGRRGSMTPTGALAQEVR